VSSPFRELPALTPAGAFARQAGGYLAVGAAVALAAWILRGGLPPIGLRLTIADAALGLAGVATYLAYNVAISLGLGRTAWGRDILGWLNKRNATLFGRLPLWTMLLMALFAGVAEEIVFRGWMQPLAGVWLTSALFAVLHFLPTRFDWSHRATWQMAAIYFPVGVAVGFLYDWRANLLAPMLMHWLSDSIGLLALARRRTALESAAP
jgi:membrane protease YdiL (CAAX protease family)